MSDLAGDAEKSPHNKIALRARLLTARRSLTDAARAAAAAQVQDQTLSLVRRAAPFVIAAYVPVGSEPGGPELPHLLAGVLPPGGRLLLPVLLPDGDLDWALFTGPTYPDPPASAVAAPASPPTAGTPSPASSPLAAAPPPASLPPTAPPRTATPASSPPAATPASSLPTATPSLASTPPTAMPSPGGLLRGPRGLLEPEGPRLGVDAIREADLVLVPALAVGRDGTRMGRGGGSYDRALARLPVPGPLIVALLHDGEDLDEVPAEPHDRRVGAVITPTGGFSLKPDPEWTN